MVDSDVVPVHLDTMGMVSHVESAFAQGTLVIQVRIYKNYKPSFILANSLPQSKKPRMQSNMNNSRPESQMDLGPNLVML